MLVAVGGTPDLPKLPGIEHAITSDHALALPALPKVRVRGTPTQPRPCG